MRSLLTLALALGFGAAQASTIVSMVGDMDNFGLTAEGPNAPDGSGWSTDLGGSFGFPSLYQEASDPSFTDKWDADVDVTYQHGYVLDGPVVSADLELHVAGIADDRGPWDVFFNNTLIGVIGQYSESNAFERTRTLNFSVPVNLLTSNDTILLAINNPTVTDGYSINYSKLTIETVPEPGTIAAVSLGFAALARRRRR